MGESKSPALPLGDGALNLAKYGTRLQRPTASVATTEELGIIGETERNAVHGMQYISGKMRSESNKFDET